MITYDRYLAILAQSDAAAQQAAAQAFAQLLEKIRQGHAPRSAIDAILREFNADTLTGFAEAFSAILESSLGEKELKNWPVGGVKLSDRLYQNAQQVSATTRQIIEEHMKGLHSARELRKALYEGYDFQKDPLDIIKPLPKYLQVEFDKFKAAQLKTPALRAAYLEAIRRAEAGAGREAIEKKLRIAFYERNRYFANRIARTELHRAYTDQQARELMDQDRIQYVQIRLSSKHLKTDICCRAGTLITTATGLKPIESVAIGDNVLTHRGRWRQVMQLYRRALDETDTLVQLAIQTESGRFHQVTLTPNHPVLTDQGWIPAGDLKIGSQVFSAENTDFHPPGGDAFYKAPLGFPGSWITQGLKITFSELCGGLLAGFQPRTLRMLRLCFSAPKLLRIVDDDICQHYPRPLSSLDFLTLPSTSIDEGANQQNDKTCRDGACHSLGSIARVVADKILSSKSLWGNWVKKQHHKLDMFLIGKRQSKTGRLANWFQTRLGTYRRLYESWGYPVSSYIHYGMISGKTIVQSKGETVFNLGVADDQSYVAGGLVVHNCDLHAKLDAYGLGPGVYPKADAPKPPFHPHCYCLLSPRIDLINPNPRFNPKAERTFLQSLPAKEARDVAGSWEKRRRILEDKETLESIYNAGKDPLYQWKKIGDIEDAND